MIYHRNNSEKLSKGTAIEEIRCHLFCDRAARAFSQSHAIRWPPDRPHAHDMRGAAGEKEGAEHQEHPLVVGQIASLA